MKLFASRQQNIQRLKILSLLKMKTKIEIHENWERSCDTWGRATNGKKKIGETGEINLSYGLQCDKKHRTARELHLFTPCGSIPINAESGRRYTSKNQSDC